MKVKIKIFIAFLLNLLFSIIEFIGGAITGSISITSDALHDFGDALSIGLAFIFEKISGKKPNDKFTYGYIRFSVLGGLITTLILLISSVFIINSAILRITNPTKIDNNGMLVLAIIGLIFNLIATIFTHGGKSINQKAVNLHMLEDCIGWFAVLICAITMRYTNFYIIDPILSIVLALIIIVSSIKNLVQILNIFLLRTPKNIKINELIKQLKNIENVIDVHHIHVWTLDGEINCATLHVVTSKTNLNIKKLVKDKLNENKILHSTIEIETYFENCTESTCDIKDHITNINHHHHH